MNDNQSWTDTGINVIQDVTRFLWSVASLLAPWLVPFAPAIFLGWSVYETAGRANMPLELAVVAAVAAAVGLETVNIGANHATLHLSHNYEEHIPKFVFSILLVLAYVTAGVVSMAYLSVALSVKVIGIAMFALAPVAIAVQALTMDLVKEEREQEQGQILEQGKREWERRQAELEARRKHERKLEFGRLRWQYKTEIALADTDRTMSGQPAEKRTSVRRWSDKASFLSDTDRPADLTAIQVADMAGVSERTARRWLKAARNGSDEVTDELHT